MIQKRKTKPTLFLIRRESMKQMKDKNILRSFRFPSISIPIAKYGLRNPYGN